jgi:hypothetical protein
VEQEGQDLLLERCLARGIRIDRDEDVDGCAGAGSRVDVGEHPFVPHGEDVGRCRRDGVWRLLSPAREQDEERHLMILARRLASRSERSRRGVRT